MRIYEFFVQHKVLACVFVLILIKVVWVAWACCGNGSFDGEKADILQRRNYLLDKVVVEPNQLLREMPRDIGLQFQGEWALYSCSMTAQALANIASLYPETREEAIAKTDSLIHIVMSPELRAFDKLRWGEDPLETLAGDVSHLGYISHLAWMIGNYRRLTSDDSKYNVLHDALCSALNRRILASETLCIPTYPGEPIYMPDMLVGIVALRQYPDGKYASTVERWLGKASTEWIDSQTGLLASFLDESGNVNPTIKGSYSALNTYYLTLINPGFAETQYRALKESFKQSFPFCGVKEYHDRTCWFGMDIDAGPIICNLSPSGTAFAIGSATYFGDNDFRNKLLRTAEIAGHTVKWNDKRHYLLGEIALVGEAIALAMRTNLRHLPTEASAWR